MKHLLKAVLVVPFLLTACDNKKTPDGSVDIDKATEIDKNWDDTIEDAAVFSRPDNIGDTYAKSYSVSDNKVIDELWKSTFPIFANDGFGGSGSTEDQKCDSIYNGTSVYDDITKPDVDLKAPYGDKDADASLNTSAATTPYTNLPNGEDRMASNGTGWTIGQSDTHVYIATNFHVVMKPNKIASESTNDGPGTPFSCIITWDTNGSSTKARIDKSLGSNGIVYNGREASNDRWSDFVIMAFKKTEFNIVTPSLRISERFKKPNNFNDTLSHMTLYQKEQSMYSAGFPQGTRRKNRTLTNSDAMVGSDTPYVSNNITYKTDIFSFNMFSTAGASGSPVINRYGEIEFLMNQGYKNPDWLTGFDHWTEWRNAGIPAYELKSAMENDICKIPNLNMDTCK